MDAPQMERRHVMLFWKSPLAQQSRTAPNLRPNWEAGWTLQKRGALGKVPLWLILLASGLVAQSCRSAVLIVTVYATPLSGAPSWHERSSYNLRGDSDWRPKHTERGWDRGVAGDGTVSEMDEL